MPRPDLSHRSALVQRCILTAISDVRLVDTDYDVLTATVGSITATHKCSISVTANGAAGLDLVLAQKADLDYGQIGACINARIAELDCLSGRPSKLLRRASVTIKARVRVFVGELAAASEIHANGGTSSSIIDRALNHISAVDKMLGVRDMRLVSLEQRVNLLLLLGLEQPPPYCLDETMCGGSGEGGGSSGGASICPIEEIGERDLEDPCCATGCEPCVWETYYANQAKERYVRLKAEAAPHGDVRKRQRRMDTVTDIVTDDKSKGGAIRDSSGGDGDEVGASEAQPASASEAEASEVTREEGQALCTLTPDRLAPMPLLRREQHTSETLILTFRAHVPVADDAALPVGDEVPSPPPVPWHIKLRTPTPDGKSVTRAYTVLRCGGGELVLLVKVHPHGKCSQALARLAIGETVQARGPISTDRELHRRLFAPPPTPTADRSSPKDHLPAAIHCVSAGTGISPMVQIADAVVRHYELSGRAGGAGGGEQLRETVQLPIIRLWSFTRLTTDAVVPAHLSALQRRATKIGLSVHLASIFTRESNAPPRPKPADPCAPHGGRSRVLCGRPDLDTLLYGISEEEIASAVLVICGPDEFNDSMRAAALEGTGRYPPARVFVRDTPPPPAADR